MRASTTGRGGATRTTTSAQTVPAANSSPNAEPINSFRKIRLSSLLNEPTIIQPLRRTATRAGCEHCGQGPEFCILQYERGPKPRTLS